MPAAAPWYRVTLLTVLTALVLLPIGAADVPPPTPADWPLFRGTPLQTGVSTGGLPDKLEQLWKVKLGDGIEGSAVVAGGVAYVGCFDEHLYAFDLTTGHQRWAVKLGPIKASPAVRGDTVYVGDVNGLFHAVDLKTGAKKWSYETDGEIDSSANFAGDVILFGSNDSNLYAVSPQGKKIWTLKTQDRVNGAPAVVDNRTFVAGCDGSLHIVDLTKGAEVESVPLNGPAGASAAVRGDRLYVGTMSNQFLAIDWKKPGIAWTFEAERPQPFYSSAAVTDRLAVVGSQDKRVYGIELATGKLAWSFLTEKKVDASPVIAGARVYAPSTDGTLYVLDVATGKEVQRIRLGSPVLASPAVAEGRLVIGTMGGSLSCFGAR